MRQYRSGRILDIGTDNTCSHHRVSQIFVNQKDLEQEAKNLSLQSARYAKQTTQWLALVSQFDSALKVGTTKPFSVNHFVLSIQKVLMRAIIDINYCH